LDDGPSAVLPTLDLDARIAAAFAEDTVSDDVQCLLVAVEAAAMEAEAEAEEARACALDPLVEDLIVARRAMDDAAFKRDRLTEAVKRLGVRVDELMALEKARAHRAQHDRILAERNVLAEEMERMAEPIVQIALLVSKIEACDREVGWVNATSALEHGHIGMVLSGAAPAIRALFQDAVVWDAFIAVAGRASKDGLAEGLGQPCQALPFLLNFQNIKSPTVGLVAPYRNAVATVVLAR
jgi:hypothetical protein